MNITPSCPLANDCHSDESKRNRTTLPEWKGIAMFCYWTLCVGDLSNIRSATSTPENEAADLLRNNTGAAQLKTLKMNSGHLSLFHPVIYCEDLTEFLCAFSSLSHIYQKTNSMTWRQHASKYVSLGLLPFSCFRCWKTLQALNQLLSFLLLVKEERTNVWPVS